jgi:hypothetical protein
MGINMTNSWGQVTDNTKQLAEMSKYPELETETGVVDKYYPYGDVRRFGAVGDGEANDTIAFQNAIAQTASYDIYIPCGRFKLTEELVILYKNVHGTSITFSHPDLTDTLEASGDINTILDFTLDTGTTAITWTTNAGIFENVFAFNSSNPANSVDGINFAPTAYENVRNVVANGFTGKNIFIETSYSYYENIYANGENECTHGIVLSNTTDTSPVGSTGNIVIRPTVMGKCSTGLRVGGINNKILSPFIRIEAATKIAKLSFEEAINCNVENYYVEQDGSDTYAYLKFDENSMSNNVKNIYCSAVLTSNRIIDAGRLNSYNVSRKGLDFQGLIKQPVMSKNYFEHSFIINASNKFELVGDAETTIHQPSTTAVGNTVNADGSISWDLTALEGLNPGFSIRFSDTFFTKHNIDRTKTSLMCGCKITFTDVVTQTIYTTLNAETGITYYRNGFYIQVAPVLTSAQNTWYISYRGGSLSGTVTISELFVYVIDDIANYNNPTVNKLGDYMVGNLQFYNGSPVIKDTVTETYYKITVASGVLGVTAL